MWRRRRAGGRPRHPARWAGGALRRVAGVPRFSSSRRVDPATAERLLRPRDDIVGEVAEGDGHFGLEHGPFEHYERHVVTEKVAPAQVDGNGAGSVLVTQTVDFRLPTGTWPFLMNHAVRSALKRPPAGFDAKHPFVEDLKRKDFYSLIEFSEQEVVAPDFLDRFTNCCERVAPLIEFQTRALGLRW